MKNLNIYGSDYYSYMDMLSSGNIFRILISKRLLLRPVIPVWFCLFWLFLVPSNTFFAMVGLPSLIIFGVYLAQLYQFWSACGISKKAYSFFHAAAVLLLKILSSVIIALLGVL